MGNKDKSIVNDGVVFFKSKSLGSIQNILDVTLPTIVAVKVEKSKEVFDFLEVEDGVFGDDVFGKHSLALFISDFFFVHEAHVRL